MYLETLSNLPGVSGSEGEVRRAVVRYLEEHSLEYFTDSIGNLFVRKRGAGREPGVMLSAHMDEVGLIITGIEKSGHLRFKPVGAIDVRVLVSKAVRIGTKGIPGVVASKAIHLQKPDERKKPYRLEQLLIDIGARKKEDAEKYVQPGDYASFDAEFKMLGDKCCCGKAFDDRAGCAVLLELLLENNGLSFDAVFTVQEEVGSRGATVAAHRLRPRKALVIETTAASDTPEAEGAGVSTSLGKGPAISIMDQSVFPSRDIMQELIDAAGEAGVAYQYRMFTGGLTDAGAVAMSREGVKTAVLSIPCRYIHSPYGVLNLDDFNNTVSLVRRWLESRA